MRFRPLFLLLALLPGMSTHADPHQPARDKARKLVNDGNVKEAFEVFSTYLEKPDLDPIPGVEDLNVALQCLQRLNRDHETDTWREKVAAAHAGNWRMLQGVAQTYQQAQHYGFVVSGQFERGHHRGGGKQVSSMERDRVRSMQLMAQALPLVGQEPVQSERASFYFQYAHHLLHGRGYWAAWELQALTDLSKLPDYEEGNPWSWRNRGGQDKGAAVDANGEPVFHKVPVSWEAAASDGERWRWLLDQAAKSGGGDTAKHQLAEFLQQQFDVQTLARWNWYFNRVPDEQSDTRKDTSGTYELHKLGDDETIARLATGIRRFKLPDEFNFIRMYTELKNWDKLAEIATNRRQYPKAAELWTTSIKQNGDSSEWRSNQRKQITANWGRFENNKLSPAGEPAELLYRFRNGKKATFEAWAIDTDALLKDIKLYLMSDPAQLDWERMQIDQIGHQMVMGKADKYRGDSVAKWEQALEPLPGHFDRRVTVKTPLKNAGAYLVRSRMEDGNECYIVVWLADLAIVKKPLASGPGENSKGAYYFIADAVTGAPVAGAEAEFFGYWGVPVRNASGRRYQNIKTTRFSVSSDAQGQVIPDGKDLVPDPAHGAPQFIVTAKAADGRKCFFGFDGVWIGQWHDVEYNEMKYYGISDRPVYRPEQKVEFKAWIRQAQYDMPDTSPFAGREFGVIIRDPQGNEVFNQRIKADDFAGVAGTHTLPKGAALGVYSLTLDNNQAATFRVEEYKKPEFEVKVDAPSEPVKLGEKVEAVVTAKYYFGAPVVKAKVKVKVERSAYDGTWYAPMSWDWCYGPGYGWFCWDYVWWPGWRDWGCRRPLPWWFSGPVDPPELVMENEMEIGPDGTVKVAIDTAIAKAMHGDEDHRYTLTVEVTDESRRTITGSGAVMVARKPFKVFTWVDRGHYNVGDTVQASMQARTLDGKPVPGKGVLKLLSVTHGDEGPQETVVQTWDLDTNEAGTAAQKFTASKPGQYRLSYSVLDVKGNTIEGGYVFIVRGEGDDGRKHRFNQIELIADKREYSPGEKVKLAVNTDRENGTVVLFARPANGVYLMPQVIRLKGKTTAVEIEVTKKDMPNFFIEAFTVSDGEVHSQTVEIIVPPEQRVAQVEIVPSAEKYLPGQEASVTLKLTDLQGKPFVGAAVLSAYDRAVEYIAGPNVPEIKEFFWKWRRSHSVNVVSSLMKGSWPMTKPKDMVMGSLGVFGESVADDGNAHGFGDRSVRREAGMKFKGMAARGGGEPMVEASLSMPAPAAPMAEMAMDAVAFSAPAGAAMEKKEMGGDVGGGGASPAEVQPTVRSEFADTAYWNAILQSDSNGVAKVSFKMPDNLTGWKLRGWAMGHGTRVGEGTVEVVTAKNLMLRLQAPRFFVEKDEVVLSANVHNYLDAEKKVRVVLELDGKTLEAMVPVETNVTIGATGEQRVDWRVKVLKEGEAVIRMKALTDVESDAMEMKFPVYVHGMLKTESFSRAIRPEGDSAVIEFKVPNEIRPNESVLEARWSPTLAGAMVDALPYLVDYPYGCTEQTLSRFLPTVMTQKVLKDMGVDLKALKDKKVNLNAQEIGDDVERAKQWQRYDRNPVFDEEEVARMAKEGLKRLYDMQCSDGGWGWFSGSGEHSWPHTTAHVVHGLQIAQAAGLDVSSEVLNDGLEWLKRHQAEETRRIRDEKARDHKRQADAMDAFAFMILAQADRVNEEMLGYLYRDRVDLPVYAKAMFGIGLDVLKRIEQRDMIVRNIDQFLVTDKENQTAYLNLGNEGYWWYWYGSEYEAQAYYLKLLSRTDPKGEKASGLVKYLLNNRKHATYWKSTRDTAVCVEAMAEYIKASGEDKPDMTLEVVLDGKKLKEVRITPDNLFGFDNKLVLFGDAVEPGAHKLELRRKGAGPLYANVYLTYFSLEDRITKAGLEIKVDRKVYKLVPEDKTVNAQGAHGQVVSQKVEKYTRVPLEDGAVLKSGDLVEVELSLESKNDYEYLIFEDYKAAGFEAVEVRSGYNGNDLGAYVEFRDERVAFFTRALARGKHSVSYRLRAEIPGKFSALPARGFAMYAPELKANSDEFKVGVED